MKTIQLFSDLWKFIRRISGDDAYERYLQHHTQAHPDQAALTRKSFFKQEQERKWNGVKRCC